MCLQALLIDTCIDNPTKPSHLPLTFVLSPVGGEGEGAIGQVASHSFCRIQ